MGTRQASEAQATWSWALEDWVAEGWRPMQRSLRRALNQFR